MAIVLKRQRYTAVFIDVNVFTVILLTVWKPIFLSQWLHTKKHSLSVTSVPQCALSALAAPVQNSAYCVHFALLCINITNQIDRWCISIKL